MKKLTYIILLAAFWTNFVQSQNNPTYTPKLLTTATGVYIDNNDKPIITRDYNDSLFLAFTGIYSNDNARNEVGNNPTYISGSGLDAIYDFSVLSDIRLNKNAYLGNAFGLPEYWDFPWNDSIYYDSGNPYHWKLKDFHYRYLESMVYDADLSNCFFAKLTYSAEVLQSVDEIYIYSSPAADSSELLSYIGILPDFEEQVNVNPEIAANVNNITPVGATITYLASFEGRDGVLRGASTANFSQVRFDRTSIVAGDVVRIKTEYYQPISNVTACGILIRDAGNDENYYAEVGVKGTWNAVVSNNYTVISTPDGQAPWLYFDNASVTARTGDITYINYYRLYKIYENYYNQEVVI